MTIKNFGMNLNFFRLNLDGIEKSCKKNEIKLTYQSDKLVSGFFTAFNTDNVQKFCVGDKLYAFITKTDNLSEKAKSDENKKHIYILGDNYAIIVVSGTDGWELYDEFNCELDEDWNVTVSTAK